jgi:catechol 2,3-dioxygenase-like lactoylglutathione lyase family enzyme
MGNTFRAVMMFHPSHRVPDLDEAEQFFARVFGRSSQRLAALVGGGEQDPNNRNDYSVFTTIQEVIFDSIDPKLMIKEGVQWYPDVDVPHLNGMGWYVEGLADAYRAIKSAGFDVIDQRNEPAVGDEPPTVIGSKMQMFWTTPENAGLRYQFLPLFPFPGDPRLVTGWELPPVPDDDPLGIERCSHHTVLTDQPERALRLFVDALGGSVIHSGRDDVVGATSTYVHLADGVYEFAVPDEGTPAHLDWAERAPADTYHGITFKVVDLDRVARHLESQGVQLRSRTEQAIVTDPATSLGVPWAFTTALTPGDPR